jgi:fatty-acyl-CoA synthase
LASRLDALAATQGDRAALLTATETVSFSALASGARAAAAGLSRLGVNKETRVGLLMPNCPDWLRIAFAVWRLGAVLVPINTLFRKAELAYALTHADVAVLITTPSFLSHSYTSMLRELCPELDASDPVVLSRALPSLRTVVVAGEPRLPATYAWADVLAGGTHAHPSWERNVADSVSPSDDATVFFTSGSTAAPKGVVHTHATMLQAADNVAERLGLVAADRTYGYLPFFFNGGLVGVALATLSRGAAVILQEVFRPAESLALLEQHGCTTIFAWPHQGEALVTLPQFDRQRLQIHKGVGASAKWAPQLYPPTHQALSTWGMTETGPMAACSRWDESLVARTNSHGWPMPGLEMRIVDPATGAPVPAETDGEIVVRGGSVMRTYYKMPVSECFDVDGFFHTGDCGHLDGAGRLHFLGRIKDVIKTAGVNVAAAEVETIMLAHPGVKVVHVVPVPHPTRGENIAAFVVCSDGAVSAADLQAHCQSQLASYKVPRHLFICDESDLPTLGSGKVDRQALRRRAAELVGGGQ